MLASESTPFIRRIWFEPEHSVEGNLDGRRSERFDEVAESFELLRDFSGHVVDQHEAHEAAASRAAGQVLLEGHPSAFQSVGAALAADEQVSIGGETVAGSDPLRVESCDDAFTAASVRADDEELRPVEEAYFKQTFRRGYPSLPWQRYRRHPG